jgi:hypothetical protein
MDRDDADEAVVRAAREGGGDDELAAQLHALRDELTAPASPRSRLEHLAAMRRATADPTVELAADETAEIPVEETVATATPLRHRHRAVVLVAAATVGVLGLTGGLAAAGRLPASAQDRVADIVKVVGIDLPNHDNARDVGPGNGRENLRPTTPTAGASGTAPPVGPQGPGATGTLPGSSGSAPGHSPTGPGNSENAPGHTSSDPGSSGNGPGQTGTNGNGNDGNRNDGNNGQSPGQTGSNGSSDNAPGQSRGNAENAPGRNKDTIAPGKSGSAPGQNNEKAGSSPVQGTDQ